MKQRLSALMLFAALACAIFVAPLGAAAAPFTQVQNPDLDAIPITGTVPGLDGIFEGTLDINRFIVQNGEIFAVGTLTGDILDAAGDVFGSVTNVPVQLPVGLDFPDGTCEILDLQLGPLDLDLLGLQVFLDEVNLEITAQAGPGNLLGNLLCAVAGLLDGGGPLQGIVGLLNNILRQL